MTKVRLPVMGCNLVFDEMVNGAGVWYAEQCLSQAHQRDALIGGQPVFGEEHFHQPGVACATHSLNQTDGTFLNSSALAVINACTADQ